MFYREGRVNPFLSLGLGRVKSHLKPGADEDDITALFGGGLLIDLGSSRDDGSAMQLRADLGARRGLSERRRNSSTRSTTSPGLGLQY